MRRTATIRVTHQGREMKLAELSKLVGINYHTLTTRYLNGDRGEALIRPAYKRSSSTPPTNQMVLLSKEAGERRTQRQKAAQIVSMRATRQQSVVSQLKRAIASEISRSLSDEYVSPRAVEKAREQFVGRQRWKAIGD